MPRFHVYAALFVLSLLGACGGEFEDDGANVVAPPSSAAPSPSATAGQAVSEQTSCGLTDFQRQVMERVNQARAASQVCGSSSFPAVPALAWEGRLFAAAAGHAQDMATNNYFSHDGLDGRTFSQRISDTGYVWSAVGENIAAGQIDPAQVVGAWMDSPGHCANVMSDSFTEVAVACVRNDASTHVQYWAMSLGRPR